MGPVSIFLSSHVWVICSLRTPVDISPFCFLMDGSDEKAGPNFVQDFAQVDTSADDDDHGDRDDDRENAGSRLGVGKFY